MSYSNQTQAPTSDTLVLSCDSLKSTPRAGFMSLHTLKLVCIRRVAGLGCG